jgi:hypothetical protein
MTPDHITGWLHEPSTLPEDAQINELLRVWPWFVPGKLMDAVRRHQQAPFSAPALSAIQLYSSDWLPAYRILSSSSRHDDNLYVPPSEAVEQSVDLADESPDKVENTSIWTHEDEVDTKAVEETEQEHSTEPLIQPLYTEDYFRHQGVPVENEIPENAKEEIEAQEPQTLMVMMSFAEWLGHFKVKSQKEQEEAQGKRALRSMWQQEKLAAALEDEPDEIPEDVFEMAVTSITKEDDLVSESLAQIYERQEKWSAASEMYRKLALKYPTKSTYFAGRAQAAKKRLS